MLGVRDIKEAADRRAAGLSSTFETLRGLVAWRRVGTALPFGFVIMRGE
jgi:hypothetical protein